jgi:multidrug efflux pump subunit AcrA (membrane-fusion protein)
MKSPWIIGLGVAVFALGLWWIFLQNQKANAALKAQVAQVDQMVTNPGNSAYSQIA